MKKKEILNKLRILAIATLIGVAIFYFLVHPFTMMVYRAESMNVPYSFSLFGEIFSNYIMESFTWNMLRMSTSYSIFGGVLGLGFGWIWMSLQSKNKLILQQSKFLAQDVKQLINMGENAWVEFKSSLRYDYQREAPNKELEMVIAKTIVGFLNAKGGRLLIGVDDKGTILGLENDYNTLRSKDRDGFELKLFQLIKSSIGQQSCYNVHVAFHLVDGKDLCIVAVDPSPEPVYLIEGKKTTFYVRTGNSTYPLSVKDAIDYVSKRSQ